MSAARPSKPAAAAGELSGLLKKAEALQKELERIRSELRQETLEMTDSEARVRICCNGEGVPQSVALNFEGLDAALGRAIEDALAQCLRTGMEQLFRLRRQRLGEASRGLNLPELYS